MARQRYACFKNIYSVAYTLVLGLKKSASPVKQIEAIPVQVWTGSKGSRRLRLPGFKRVGTCRW
jgi:hypothetical protein